MSSILFKIELACEAEPATGLGNNVVNSIVPRDERGVPCIPASHLKGLMRAALKEISSCRPGWGSLTPPPLSDGTFVKPRSLAELVFGGDDAMLASYASTVRVDTAKVPEGFYDQRDTPESILITRTELDESGIAADTSLRTTEAISKGTIFEGEVFTDVDAESIEGIAIKLALVAIDAIGGSRSRAGQCVVSIVGAADVVGEVAPHVLLKQLDQAIEAQRFAVRPMTQPSSVIIQAAQNISQTTHVPSVTLVELLFVAETPICLPEKPDRANLITSGFSIPATAVQGLLLHHAARTNTVLADRLFAEPSFRCWPLHPCSLIPESTIRRSTELNLQLFNELPSSVRVSLSHRSAKFAIEEFDETYFFEPSLECSVKPYAWPDVPSGAPLKGSDGVLLSKDGETRLWKASEMPRHLSAHGVLDGPSTDGTIAGRNLYTVESMIPMYWRGYLALPNELADDFVTSLNQRTEYRFGKGRSVRGRGRLMARFCNGNALPGCADATLNGNSTFILQSPLEIPTASHEALVAGTISAEDCLGEIAKQWSLRHGLSSQNDPSPLCWASTGLRFGWSRHTASGYQAARAVIEPGSVFMIPSMSNDVVKLKNAIVAGLCADTQDSRTSKQQGFGCIAIHPGKATAFYAGSAQQSRRGNASLAQVMKQIVPLGQFSHLPSTSQIRSLQQRIALTGDPQLDRASLKDASDYLAEQLERSTNIRVVWEPVAPVLSNLLNDEELDATAVVRGLKTLADIAAARTN